MAPLKWHYGDVIRKRRDERKWSQEDLAERSGVGVGKIRRIESGDENYAASAQRLLAQAFGTTVAAMMAEIPPTPNAVVRDEEKSASG